MTKKTTIYIFVILLVIMIFGFTFFLVDFNLALRGNAPRLAIKSAEYNDGNTLCYIGLGYKIIIYNTHLEEFQVKGGSFTLMHDPNLDKKEENINADSIENKYIIGEITELANEDFGMQILVKSTSKESVYNEALVNVSSSTVITKEKSTIYKNDLKVGDKVKISFGGIATRSIPPQVTALKIEIK